MNPKGKNTLPMCRTGREHPSYWEQQISGQGHLENAPKGLPGAPGSQSQLASRVRMGSSGPGWAGVWKPHYRGRSSFNLKDSAADSLQGVHAVPSVRQWTSCRDVGLPCHRKTVRLRSAASTPVKMTDSRLPARYLTHKHRCFCNIFWAPAAVS